MLIAQINPFLRYAKLHQWQIPPIPDFACAFDYRLFYVINGSIELSFNNQAYTLEPHSIAYISPGTPYHFYNIKDAEIALLNFDFTQNFFEITTPICPVLECEFSKERIIETIAFEDSVVFNNSFCLQNIDFIQKEINEILYEFRCKKRYYHESASAVLKEVFIKLARYFTLSLRETKVDSVLEYIHMHYNESLDNEGLAKFSGYHPSYLNSLIKQTTGVSLKQYIIKLRLEEAQQMLISTNQSVSEIALACGYENASYFSAAFYEKMGLSPLQYRKNALKYGMV